MGLGRFVWPDFANTPANFLDDLQWPNENTLILTLLTGESAASAWMRRLIVVAWRAAEILC